jgi:allophanate hydrolase
MPTENIIFKLLAGSLSDLLTHYRGGKVTPEEIVQAIIETASSMHDNPIWITPPNKAAIQPFLDRLTKANRNALPLWGVPFAVKDNIDVAGFPTTAGCPEYEYEPHASAFAVEKLIEAGAIPVGKTNLDQFATGLVGVRSPYGTPINPEAPELIPGGSSSGSAIAVACGLVSFALGTDTAGSGRIPAAFNGLIGLKPSRGLISNDGIVPACRSLDCVSIFARETADTALIASIVVGHNPKDAFSRHNKDYNRFSTVGRWPSKLTLGVLPDDQLEFFGDSEYASAYHTTIQTLADHGVQFKVVDFSPFVSAAAQLYEGPWVTERYLALADVLNEKPDAFLPVTRKIIEEGRSKTAAEAFLSIYSLADLRLRCLDILQECDALLTPTAGKHFSIDEVAAEPINANSKLGHYTNYMNLLDLCGIAIPGASTPSGRHFGVTLVADAFKDTRLLSIADKLEGFLRDPFLRSTDTISDRGLEHQDLSEVALAVCGAHMKDLPLNFQLTERNGRFVETAKTASQYRLFALKGGPPARPGLIRDSSSNTAIDLEIWSLPADTVGSFVAGIPSPLGIGTIEIEDGRRVLGFLCEQAGLAGAEDITALGGWRAYLKNINK